MKIELGEWDIVNCLALCKKSNYVPTDISDAVGMSIAIMADQLGMDIPPEKCIEIVEKFIYEGVIDVDIQAEESPIPVPDESMDALPNPVLDKYAKMATEELEKALEETRKQVDEDFIRRISR